jgi:hypothetical protein
MRFSNWFRTKRRAGLLVRTRSYKTTRSDGTCALFWFNWPEISAAGKRRYGRYVFESLLPCFLPTDNPFDLKAAGLRAGGFFFFDGDCFLDGPLEIPVSGSEQARTVDALALIDHKSLYVVAVLASGHNEFSGVDAALRAQRTIGYAGITSCSSIDFDSFETLTKNMSLPFAFHLGDARIQKNSFSALTDLELQRLGFSVAEWRR